MLRMVAQGRWRMRQQTSLMRMVKQKGFGFYDEVGLSIILHI